MLASGVTVLTLPSRGAGLASIVVISRHGGSAYDPPGREGLGVLAHRMILRGSALRSAAEVAAALDSLGARSSVQNDMELGTVSLTAPSSSFVSSVDLLLECLTSPGLDSLEVIRERSKMLAELAAREDRLLTRAFDLFHETYFAGHPYHAPSMGYPGSIGDLTSESVAEYDRTHLHPADLVVSASGDFDAALLIDRLAAAFPETEEPPVRFRAPAPPAPPGEPVEEVQKRRSQQAWIVAGFPAPAPGSADEAPFAVMRSVLSGSMGSRLFFELRSRRSLAYQVGGFYRAHLNGPYFAAFIATKGTQYAEARDALVGEVHGILEAPPTETELQDARQFVRGEYLLRLERNEERAHFYGSSEALGLGLEYGAEFLRRVAAVTNDDVVRVARTYLTAPVVAAIVPEGGGS